MKQLAHSLRLVIVAIIVSVYAMPTSRGQALNELNSAARHRIEQSRASIVTVRVENESAQPVSQAVGFFIRDDLVATDIHELNAGSRLRVTAQTKEGVVKTLRSGHYFLPYVLVEKQSDISPLSLGDSEVVKVNDSVYMLDDQGKVLAGKVTGTTIIKGDRAFLLSFAINSRNKGAPIFNRDGEVIGIVAEGPEDHSSGLAFTSALLEKLKHLGEPGVGAGAGSGQMRPPAARDTDTSTSSTVDKKPVRLSSPTPRLTEAARSNGTQGTVSLRLLVGADGDVKQVRAVTTLPDGLTEQAIEVARQTKFKPAMKDGKPVPYWVSLQIEFTVR